MKKKMLLQHLFCSKKRLVSQNILCGNVSETDQAGERLEGAKFKVNWSQTVIHRVPSNPPRGRGQSKLCLFSCPKQTDGAVWSHPFLSCSSSRIWWTQKCVVTSPSCLNVDYKRRMKKVNLCELMLAFREHQPVRGLGFVLGGLRCVVVVE